MDYQYDAFISHASVDFDKYAMPLVRALEETGLKCWIAPRNIPNGEAYSGAITQGLKASKCVIFLLSKKSNQSKPVHNEIELASRYDKKLITLKLEDLQYHSNLEFHLSSKQYINAKNGLNDSVITQAKSALSGSQSTIETVSSLNQDDTKNRFFSPKITLILSILFLAIMLLGAYLFLNKSNTFFTEHHENTTSNPAQSTAPLKDLNKSELSPKDKLVMQGITWSTEAFKEAVEHQKSIISCYLLKPRRSH